MPKIIYQVFAKDYEGNEDLIDSFNHLSPAQNRMKEEAAAYQENIQEPPTRIEPMGIYFDDPDNGYNYWFTVEEITVK